MQLTRFSDFSIRILIFLGHRESPATVREISESFKVSRNHMVKVAHRMGQLGLVKSTKGSRGGLQLAKEPKDYRIGEVIAMMEPNMQLVECFDQKVNRCFLYGSCELHLALTKARNEFIECLNSYSLADLLTPRARKVIERINVTESAVP